ncbi:MULTISPECIES: 4-oxalocrotonate tautomerase [unclassified Paenibacillus]|uniref:4-oxalocrotonate tautomerase n=1 Tax=unclassified Paenibacillus TaxID=185978 RepID=UPI001AE2A343|nr:MULTISPECIES: 4-oxalocrotonate tautomerase [unclassified Paenibacillus]MBP1156902.1 4-oxalocrotonate tautomerase [Paenibacillus sp. PvP091]MBP1172359.1 4-oxalocrotonate tautomerase [Paenibacillus sp. PvR098]MBP2438740.1 4-oxalocrotonate tautomerase [Paenibacillus sp. PvP052]
MPIVNIQILEGRSPEKVKELIIGVTDAVVDKLEVKRESVRVLVTEVPKTHWGIGGVSVSDIPGR